MTLPDEAQRQALRRWLEQRADQLQAEIAAVRADLAGAPTRIQDTVEDVAEQGERRTHDALRSAEQDRDAAELRDVGAALSRLDDGSYGSCVDCGLDIAPARLQANPAVARCIHCQARYERLHPLEGRTAAVS